MFQKSQLRIFFFIELKLGRPSVRLFFRCLRTISVPKQCHRTLSNSDKFWRPNTFFNRVSPPCSGVLWNPRTLWGKKIAYCFYLLLLLSRSAATTTEQVGPDWQRSGTVSVLGSYVIIVVQSARIAGFRGNYHQWELSKKMFRRPILLTESWWVVCPVYIYYANSCFKNHSSESFSLLNSSQACPAYDCFVCVCAQFRY